MAYIDKELMIKKIREEAMTKFDWSEQIDVDDFEAVIKKLPIADVEEKKDCEKCIHFGKHATEYPCSHCRNCYTDKFQPNDTRTPKERGGEK